VYTRTTESRVVVMVAACGARVDTSEAPMTAGALNDATRRPPAVASAPPSTRTMTSRVVSP
jgi:hypothetical protein